MISFLEEATFAKNAFLRVPEHMNYHVAQTIVKNMNGVQDFCKKIEAAVGFRWTDVDFNRPAFAAGVCVSDAQTTLKEILLLHSGLTISRREAFVFSVNEDCETLGDNELKTIRHLANVFLRTSRTYVRMLLLESSSRRLQRSSLLGRLSSVLKKNAEQKVEEVVVYDVDESTDKPIEGHVFDFMTDMLAHEEAPKEMVYEEAEEEIVYDEEEIVGRDNFTIFTDDGPKQFATDDLALYIATMHVSDNICEKCQDLASGEKCPDCWNEEEAAEAADDYECFRECLCPNVNDVAAQVSAAIEESEVLFLAKESGYNFQEFGEIIKETVRTTSLYSHLDVVWSGQILSAIENEIRYLDYEADEAAEVAKEEVVEAARRAALSPRERITEDHANHKLLKSISNNNNLLEGSRSKLNMFKEIVKRIRNRKNCTKAQKRHLEKAKELSLRQLDRRRKLRGPFGANSIASFLPSRPQNYAVAAALCLAFPKDFFLEQSLSEQINAK